MYLIHIKDILQNKEYIYNINYSEQNENDFQNCIDFLKKQLPNENQNKIKYNIFQDYCEIYYDSEFKNKGWIWSSFEIRKDIIYILTKIKVLDTINIKNDNVLSIGTQTNFINNIENKIQNCNDHFINLKSINKYNNTLSSGYARNPIIPMWPDNLITELEEKFSRLNFGLTSTNPNYF